MLTKNQKLQNGRYTIIRAFGQNKIGNSYEAFDLELRKNVILKEVTENHTTIANNAQTEANRIYFAKQAEKLQQINHPGLLQVVGFFSENELLYIVAETIEGENLSKLIEINQKPFSFNAFKKWADQILESVSLLHSQSPQIIHRDIQPKYIFLKNDGTIKISILDIIQHSDLQKYAVSKDDLFESKNLAFSPLEKIWDDLDSASQNVILNNFDEQSQSILEKPADARSDIYSLGATFYFLLTAKLPIDSLSRLIDVLDGNEDPLPPPHTINSDVPKDFSDVIMKSLEIKRENRFNSVVILRQIMRTTLARLEDQANIDSSIEQVQKPKTFAVPSQTVQTTKEPAKQIESGQKQQLELMKKQLREAEQKRLAAEKRALEAEKLLQEKENFNTSPVDSFANISPSELSNADTADSVSDIEVEMEAEFNSDPSTPVLEIDADLNDEINRESADYFADLYGEPQTTESKSYLKLIVGAIILLAVGGITWGMWSYYTNNAIQTEQLVSSDENVPPVKTQEETPVPTPELSDETNVADIDTEAIAKEEETKNSPDNEEQVDTTPNASIPNRPKPKPIVKTPRQRRPVVKRPIPQKANTPAPKPKPTKKPVTLDDLINDG